MDGCVCGDGIGWVIGRSMVWYDDRHWAGPYANLASPQTTPDTHTPIGPGQRALALPQGQDLQREDERRDDHALLHLRYGRTRVDGRPPACPSTQTRPDQWPTNQLTNYPQSKTKPNRRGPGPRQLQGRPARRAQPAAVGVRTFAFRSCRISWRHLDDGSGRVFLCKVYMYDSLTGPLLTYATQCPDTRARRPWRRAG